TLRSSHTRYFVPMSDCSIELTVFELSLRDVVCSHTKQLKSAILGILKKCNARGPSAGKGGRLAYNPLALRSQIAIQFSAHNAPPGVISEPSGVALCLHPPQSLLLFKPSDNCIAGFQKKQVAQRGRFG